MKANWPWLIVYGVVQASAFWISLWGLTALGMPERQRENLATEIAFGALILVGAVDAVFRERREAPAGPGS